MSGLPDRRFARRAAVAIGALVWAVAILAGSRILFKYENTPGLPGAPPSHWPSGSRIEQSHMAFTLVLLAHPDCPCTGATLAELEAIIARSQGKLTSYVIFSKPGVHDTNISSSALWKAATRIPSVTVVYDSTGIDTSRFGGHVSGQTMLYDPNGILVFTGGITSGRGHQGDSDGADAILRRVSGEAGAVASTRYLDARCTTPARADQMRTHRGRVNKRLRSKQLG